MLMPVLSEEESLLREAISDVLVLWNVACWRRSHGKASLVRMRQLWEDLDHCWRWNHHRRLFVLNLESKTSSKGYPVHGSVMKCDSSFWSKIVQKQPFVIAKANKARATPVISYKANLKYYQGTFLSQRAANGDKRSSMSRSSKNERIFEVVGGSCGQSKKRLQFGMSV